MDSVRAEYMRGFMEKLGDAWSPIIRRMARNPRIAKIMGLEGKANVAAMKDALRKRIGEWAPEEPVYEYAIPASHSKGLPPDITDLQREVLVREPNDLARVIHNGKKTQFNFIENPPSTPVFADPSDPFNYKWTMPKDVKTLYNEPTIDVVDSKINKPRNTPGLLLRTNQEGTPTHMGGGWVVSKPTHAASAAILEKPLSAQHVWATQNFPMHAAGSVDMPFWDDINDIAALLRDGKVLQRSDTVSGKGGQAWALNVPDQAGLHQNRKDVSVRSSLGKSQKERQRASNWGTERSSAAILSNHTPLNIPAGQSEVIIPANRVTGAARLYPEDVALNGDLKDSVSVLTDGNKGIYSYNGPRSSDKFKALKNMGYTFPRDTKSLFSGGVKSATPIPPQAAGLFYPHQARAMAKLTPLIEAGAKLNQAETMGIVRMAMTQPGQQKMAIKRLLELIRGGEAFKMDKLGSFKDARLALMALVGGGVGGAHGAMEPADPEHRPFSAGSQAAGSGVGAVGGGMIGYNLADKALAAGARGPKFMYYAALPLLAATAGMSIGGLGGRAVAGTRFQANEINRALKGQPSYEEQRTLQARALIRNLMYTMAGTGLAAGAGYGGYKLHDYVNDKGA